MPTSLDPKDGATISSLFAAGIMAFKTFRHGQNIVKRIEALELQQKSYQESTNTQIREVGDKVSNVMGYLEGKFGKTGE